LSLFDVIDPTAAVGYRNLQAAQYSTEAAIKDSLEALWARYEPYADTNFCAEFARQPDTRFWEMYLTVQLVDTGKRVCRRDQLPAGRRDTGPDICIPKGRRKIWIEAIAPGPGDLTNLDHVPALFSASTEKQAQNAPRRQIELRITSALRTKTDAFRRYREKGIIGERDSCIVAVSGGQFALQAAGAGLPHAVTAVYPFGDEYLSINPEAHEVVGRGHHFSPEIRRLGGEPIPRSAFQHEYFAGVSGLIWSLRSIGNFLGQADDLVFVHNGAAEKPIGRAWIDWLEEYVPDEEGKRLTRLRHRERASSALGGLRA